MKNEYFTIKDCKVCIAGDQVEPICSITIKIEKGCRRLEITVLEPIHKFNYGDEVIATIKEVKAFSGNLIDARMSGEALSDDLITCEIEAIELHLDETISTD